MLPTMDIIFTTRSRARRALYHKLKPFPRKNEDVREEASWWPGLICYQFPRPPPFFLFLNAPLACQISWSFHFARRWRWRVCRFTRDYEVTKSFGISKQIDQSPIDGQVTELIVFSSSELQTWDHMIHSYKSCFRIPIGMGAPDRKSVV